MLEKGIWLVANGFNQVIKWIFNLSEKGIGTVASEVEPIFIIVTMIGMFFVMFGLKSLGTKLTSISILGYLIARMVMR